MVARTTVVFAIIVLVFTLTVQARLDPSKRCLQPNEQYNSCGTACPQTCEDIHNSNVNKPCTLQCVAGCFCKEGFVRKTDDSTSPCVKPEECQ